MLNIKLKYIAFVLLVLAWTGCTGPVVDDQAQGGNEPVVYLTISTRAAHTDGKESINKDGDDFEDHVHSLAMLIFDTATGNKIAEYYTEEIGAGEKSYVFTSKITPGTRDFYFVANLLPGMKEAFKAVRSRSEMNAQMLLIRDMMDALYQGASDKKGFPMARVYPNQNIVKGGTAHQPMPFRPIVEMTPEDCVKLVRVVAKLEVIFDATDVEDVMKVELINANKKFSLQKGSSEPTHYASDINMKRVIGTNSWIAYMPEAIIFKGKWWDNAGNPENKPINYFRVTSKNGKYYDIPIITHNTSIPGNNYLKFAKGLNTDKPDYSIYRNHHYKYEIKNLPNQIEIIYSITDWQVVQKDTYVGYGYSVEVGTDGNITISNVMQNCAPHKVVLKALNGAYFGNDPTQKTIEFHELADGASQNYKVNNNNVSAGHVYLEVFYNGTSTKKFIKK